MSEDQVQEYVTANGTTESQALEYCQISAPPGERPSERIRRTLRRSERIVREAAPNTSAEGYAEAASDAELVAFEYLWQNVGFVKSEGDLDSSTTFETNPAFLRALIVREMGGIGIASPEDSTQVVPNGYTGTLDW